MAVDSTDSLYQSAKPQFVWEIVAGFFCLQNIIQSRIDE